MTGDAEKRTWVLVLSGDDTVGREKARDEFVHTIEETNDSIEEERFDGGREAFASFVERMMTPSLFQSVRVFSVRHARNLSPQDCESLTDVLGMDIPDVYLIVELDDKKKKGAKDVLAALGIKGGRSTPPAGVKYLDFIRPPDYKIPEWITERVPSLFKRTISKKDAEYLVDLVGPELDTLYSELQKIDIHLPPKAAIDREAIDGITGATRTMNVFELARALGKADLPRALEIVDSLYSATFYPPTLVTALFRHFWALFRIRIYAKKNPARIKRFLDKRGAYNEKNEIGHEIGVAAGLLRPNDPVKKAYPIVILSGVVDHARTYKDPHLKCILRWLREFDIGIKTGKVAGTKEDVQILCFKIARVSVLESAA